MGTMSVFRTSIFRMAARVVVVCVALFALLVVWRLVTSTRIAEAATDTYYPSFCLGGWDKPRHASGEPETGNGDDPASFTADNSAFLEPDISAQIYCGYFPVEERDNPPVAADITLVWNFVGASAASTGSASPTTTVPAESAPAAESNATNTPAVPTSELPDGVATDTPATSTEPDASTSPATPEMPVVPESSPVPPPPPATPADAAPATTTSMIGHALRVAGMWVASHTSVAHAQETTNAVSLSDWFEVSYSLDGVRWRSLGKVNAQNWKHFTVHIPLASWDDLQNVQIMVAALPSLSERPPVYLDAMELRVQTNASLSETATAAVAAANDVVSSAADAVSSLGSSIASLFSSTSTEQQSATLAAPVAPATPLPKATRRVLQFTISGASLPTQSHVPWQESDSHDAIASSTNTIMPSVTRSDDGRSFIVSGSCSKDFATIITYRNESDYRDNPRDSIANVATPCDSGHYTFNLGSLPDSTQGGTYYLLVGEQSATGTWTPSSALLPITIQPVEVEE